MSQNSLNIIESGVKRLRHGSYKTVYLSSRGKGLPKKWRAEIQTISPSGIVRIRAWFSDKERAFNWIKGR